MKYNISGHHMNHGDALKKYAVRKMDRNIKKLFSEAVSADITLSKVEHKFFKASIKLREGINAKQVISEGVSNDAYKSFDLALQKLKAKLRKDKDIMKNVGQRQSIKYSH